LGDIATDRGAGLPADASPGQQVPRPDLPEIDFDWDESTWRHIGGRFLDLSVAAMTDWEGRRPTPDTSVKEVGERIRSGLPAQGEGADALIDGLEADLLPLSGYHGHPRWFAYITSSAVPIGVLGDLAASALNQNPSLWRAAPAATMVELETIDWIKEMLGFPDEAEGIFSSGGQMANILAHVVIRDQMAGWDVRRYGMAGPDGKGVPLRIYTSDQAHYCHHQAVEVLGMGRDAVRDVPTDDNRQMRLDSLVQMMDEDVRAGARPIAIIAAAGTVINGVVDPIPELLALARDRGLWFHVDGAYGAFGVLAPSAPPRLRAMADADSIACDPHKWLYAPIGAAATLIRKPGALQASYGFKARYLQYVDEPGRVDLAERSMENTRPFRALKVWLALRAYGREGYARMLERNIRLAAYLAALVQATPGLVMAAPRDLSIVNWRVEPASLAGQKERLDRLQLAVIHELERRGIAIISNAPLPDGSTALRACIVNFRTRPEDMELLASASLEIGEELAAAGDF
jgi:glutamate/tyrosine decarboxylase-like PLP-dependent enzyme